MKFRKWSPEWLANATLEELRNAQGQAQGNASYLGDHKSSHYWVWERRAEMLYREIHERTAEPHALGSL